jgi:cobalt/nickel transport system permease protein
VSGGHAHTLHIHGHSVLHKLAPEVKIAAMLGGLLAIVLTPREQFWAFGVYGLAVITLLGIGEIPLGFYLRRVLVEAPFVAFAVFLPFLGSDPTTSFAGLELSVEGSWAAWNILAKATLGVSLSIVLAATTEIPHILKGMARLRVPSLMIAIAGFMIRYLDVVTSELKRARIAMTARGHDARWFWQAKPLAISAGAMFIRAYERGERIHQAMLARGFTGSMPMIDTPGLVRARWELAVGFAGILWLVAATAMVLA